MKISVRLIIGFTSLLVIMVVMIFVAKNSLADINAQVEDFVNDKFPKTVEANNIIDNLNEQARFIRNILIYQDSNKTIEETNNIDESKKKLAASLKKLEETITSKEGKAILSSLMESREKFLPVMDKTLNFAQAGNYIEARNLLEDLRKAQIEYIGKVSKLIEFQTELVNQSGKDATDIYDSSVTMLYIMIFAGLLFAAGIAFWIILSITKPLNRAVAAAGSIASGDLSVNLKTNSKDETGLLLNAMEAMTISINNLMKETNVLIDGVNNGKLDLRGNADGYKGSWHDLVSGINVLVDSFVKPINITAEYVDRISKGDIPPKITDDYKGDFNEIKNNLNACIDVMSGLLAETDNLIAGAKNGKLDIRANAKQFIGGWKTLVSGVNELVDAFVAPINITAEYVDRISKGDIPSKITETYHGDFNEIKNNLNNCIDVMNGLLNETDMLIDATKNGKLDVRANSNQFTAGWNKLVSGVNELVDAFVAPINVTAEYVDRISKGDIPSKITENYHGDFNEIKNNLNNCIDVMNGLLNETDMLINATKEGKLDVRANSNQFTAGWNKLVSGVNELVDAFVAPINVTAEYVDRISKGDIPSKITENYHGDFNEIKNNLNNCIDVMNGLLNETDMLINATKEGKLDVRANSNQFTAGWKKLVSGVNELVDAFVAPINVTAEYIDRISKGDITSMITDVYNGDFNEIKQNINYLIESTNHVTGIAQNIAVGELDMEITERSAHDNLMIALKKMVTAINDMVKDVIYLAGSAVEGKLDVRADEQKHNGNFRIIVENINKTLDTFIKPIDEAGKVLALMATGELSANMIGEYTGEFSKLKNDVNSLSVSLCNVIKNVNETVQTSASSSLQISASADSLATASHEQNSQITAIAAAVEELSQTVTENSMGSQKAADVARNNGQVATEGYEVVEKTVEKMKEIAVVVKQSAENIVQLGNSSKQIGEIISVIDDIADQTNLLALNAAIEAARAGEQGRGFAVVADEVRKLAERTTEATQQIAKMIQNIQKETEMSVLAMNKGNEEVQSGISLADKAGVALKEILESSKTVIDMISQIATASEEQSVTSNEISRNIASISEVSQESARRVEDVSHSAEIGRAHV